MLAAVTWGTVGVATRALPGGASTSSLSIAFWRLALGLPALWIAGSIAAGGRMWSVARRDLAVMVLVGGLTALYQLCYFAAIPRAGVAVTSLVSICAAPVLVAWASALLERQRPSASVLAALSCAVVGTALLVGGRRLGEAAGTLWIGGALAMVSAIGYSGVVLCSRALAGRCPPLQVVAVGFTVAAVILLALALPAGLVTRYSPAGWVLLGYLGLVPTALAYALYVTGMRSVTATVASTAALLEPLTATLLAWWVFGERLRLSGCLGALLLMAGMAGLVLRRPGHAGVSARRRQSRNQRRAGAPRSPDGPGDDSGMLPSRDRRLPP